ncbi:helix-turn-helix transcriptional regulator [Streptomyces sp. NPDC002185]|uniref:helix-turn-helix domain-containing protein n=1 Tax=Streptomyces sp. NPDC002185 TaxID=3364636 RepID=UPI0036D0C927
MTTACGLCRLPEPLRSAMGTALSFLPTLTTREHQILAQLVNASESEDVARRLGISVRTVKFHIANLRRKLGGLSRFQLCLVGVMDLMQFSESSEFCAGPCSPRDAGAALEPTG